MRTKRFAAGAATGVTALTLLAGCAGQIKQLEPKLELRAAARHLADAPQAGFTLKVTGSADDLIAGLKAAQGGDQITPADDSASVRSLFASSITIAYDRAGGDRMQLSATIDGIQGTEIRVVGGTLYAKAPVTELAGKFGAGDISAARAGVTAGIPALGALFDGGWVATDVKKAAGAGLPAQNLDAGKALAELKTSASHLFEGASIVRDSADPRHLIVTSSTAKAYTELKRLMTAVGEQGLGLLPDGADAPKDRPIVLDLWIDHEKLTAIEVNILQFIDGATGRAAVRLEMTTGAAITAPPNATTIDPAALTGLTGLTGLAGASGSAADEAEVLGVSAVEMAQEEGGKPANYLKQAIGDLAGPGVRMRIVRRGTAEVTAGGSKACLTVPSSTRGEPDVVKHAC
jgi:hypothetical protein